MSSLRRIVDRAKDKLRKANETKICQRCGVCCWRRPCCLAPGDEASITRLLNKQKGLKMTRQDVFNAYLVVDEGHGFVPGYHLVPRRAQQQGGHYLSSSATYNIESPCVFLEGDKDNVCTIQEAKPHQGLSTSCWATPDEVQASLKTWTLEQLKELGWDGNRSWNDNSEEV